MKSLQERAEQAAREIAPDCEWCDGRGPIMDEPCSRCGLSGLEGVDRVSIADAMVKLAESFAREALRSIAVIQRNHAWDGRRNGPHAVTLKLPSTDALYGLGFASQVAAESRLTQSIDAVIEAAKQGAK